MKNMGEYLCKGKETPVAWQKAESGAGDCLTMYVVIYRLELSMSTAPQFPAQSHLYPFRLFVTLTHCH